MGLHLPPLYNTHLGEHLECPEDTEKRLVDTCPEVASQSLVVAAASRTAEGQLSVVDSSA